MDIGVFNVIFGIITGIVVLVILVAVHELGHGIVARRNGVVLEEFGIGFPPRAFAKKLKNGVVFSLNWLPLGGFVKLQGEHDAASKKGDYGAATFWQKTKILLAGVLVNWVVAAVLLTILALVGLPKILPNQFSVPADTNLSTGPVVLSSVVKDYPAAKAGLQSGDKIISIDGQKITTPDQLIAQTKADRGKTVTVDYTRDGTPASKKVTLRDANTAVFGSTLSQTQSIRATWSAPIVGVATTGQFTWVTIQGLGQLLANLVTGIFGQLSPDQTTRKAASTNLAAAGDSVAGPIGILGTIFPAASKAGPKEVLFLAAVISLTLAVMNTLPIPSLDGGRWFVTALYKVRKQKLTKEKEEKIQAIGFSVLMILVVVVTIGDVTKLFK
ncbi:MAG: RIP metalloprotease [Candidatus Microsaccharimonas sossegonensis]|uniref:RIP metalloprotease n=1 Tax=Candidatus Microsaccharimonas sossegonensis TaxID=2506948 RepID=A0A4Q0AHJ1_9BACT|nr:MAG: RIP metalloprotease [Candidatus Microsaccharimonas sossegonensis]